MKITKQRIVTRLILEKKGKVLLLKRTKSKGGNYSMLGGHVEDDETVIEAMIRETEEEGNIRLKRKHLEIAHVAHRKKGSEHVLYVFFSAQKWKGAVKNMEPDKCESLDWFRLDKLPSDVSPTTRTALAAYKEGTFFSLTNWE